MKRVICSDDKLEVLAFELAVAASALLMRLPDDGSPLVEFTKEALAQFDAVVLRKAKTQEKKK